MPPEDMTNPQPRASGASLIASNLGALPDIDRPDVQLAVVRQLPVEPPDRQRSLADATVAAWDAALWPEGVLSRTCYVSTDGQRVLTYEQWSDDHVGVLDHGAIAYRLYRSGARDGAPVPAWPR